MPWHSANHQLRPPTSKARFLRTSWNLRPNIAVAYLSIALAIVSIFSPLHLAYSSHRHRFNATTLLYEDIIVLDQGKRSKNSDTPSPDYSSIHEESKLKVTYVTCLLSNLFLLRYTGTPENGSFAPVINERDYDFFPRRCEQKSLSVLMRAPKQSPPLFPASV